jgi:hypothetical protein
MSEPEDPPRLLDSPDEPSGLREALRRARADVGTDAQLARLGARLGPLLGPVGAPPPVATASKLGLAAKVSWGVIAVLIAAGGAWLVSTRGVAPTVPAPARSASPPVAVVVSSPPLAPPSAQIPSVDVTPPPPPASAKPEPPIKAPPAVPTEAELLEQARAALTSGDGARALQRVNEHARRYPRGVLVQEREVLAIKALRRLGRDAEADRRAEAFSKAYPGSAFQRKLQR